MMLFTELQIETLVDIISKKVMKIVNKHHSGTKTDIANYKREVRRCVDAFEKLEHKYHNAIGDFNGKHEALPSKLADIKDTVQQHSIGVQNVYNKFLEMEKRQLEIESLLKSDKVRELIMTIPTERDINDLLRKVEQTNIGQLNSYLKDIKYELEELSDKFN